MDIEFGVFVGGLCDVYVVCEKFFGVVIDVGGG